MNRKPLVSKPMIVFLVATSLLVGTHAQAFSPVNFCIEVVNLYSQGKYTAALTMAKAKLEMDSKYYGQDHPKVAVALNNLAELYRIDGEFGKAELLHMKSLVLRKDLYGHGHPSYAVAMNNLAELYHSLGRYKEAETYHRRALKVFVEFFGTHHPKTLNTMNNLAELYYTMGMIEEAKEIYQLALDLNQSTYGPNHIQTQAIRKSLKSLYLESGDYMAALRLDRENSEVNNQNSSTDLAVPIRQNNFTKQDPSQKVVPKASYR